MYATAAFQAMNLDPKFGLTFLQFRDAVYGGKLQVGGLWASVTIHDNFTNDL